MKVRYFNDTDTAHMEFSENSVNETREISEDVYLDLDKDGRLVAITIEHAKARAAFPEVVYEQVG